MSEGSKMGLFGSKDKTKDLKKENSSKEESPERYAPYCIDSDSETYDTEALSMMDINDIIGIQSDPVGESTLESEIAALSQMITESKGDSVRKEEKKDLGIKPAHRNNSMIVSEKVLISEDSICDKDSLVSDVNLSDTSHSEAMSETGGVSNSLQVINDADKTVETSVKEDSSANNSKKHSDDSNLNHTVENDTSTCFRIDDNLTDPVNGPCNKEDSVSTEETESLKEKQILIDQSSNIISTESIQNVNTKEVDRKINNDNGSIPDDSIPSTLKEEDTVPNIENISKSLQLIGEAYTSEDSQETNSNDNESEKIRSSLSIKETATKDDAAEVSFVVNDKDNETVGEEESSTNKEIVTPEEDNSDTNLCQKSVDVVEESSNTMESPEGVEPSKNEQNNENTPSIPQQETQPECSETISSIDTEEVTKADECTESTNNTEQVQNVTAKVDQGAEISKDDEPSIDQEIIADEQEHTEKDVNIADKNLEDEEILEENSETTKAASNVDVNVQEKTIEEKLTACTVTVPEAVERHLSNENLTVNVRADVEMDADDTSVVDKCTVEPENDADVEMDADDTSVVDKCTIEAVNDADVEMNADDTSVVEKCTVEAENDADVEMDADDTSVVEKCTVEAENDANESECLDTKEEENYIAEENSSIKEPSTNVIEEMETDTAYVSGNTDDNIDDTSKELDENEAAEGSKEIESSETDNNILVNSVVETSIVEEKIADVVLKEEKSPTPQHVTENVNVSTNDDGIDSNHTVSKLNVNDLEEEDTDQDAENDVSKVIPETTTAEDDCNTVDSPTEKLTTIETCEASEEIELKSDTVVNTEENADVPVKEVSTSKEDPVMLEKTEENADVPAKEDNTSKEDPVTLEKTEENANIPVKEDSTSKEDPVTLEKTEVSVDLVEELENVPEPSVPSREQVEIPSEVKKEVEKDNMETDGSIEENTIVLNDIPKTSDEENILEEKQNPIPEDMPTPSTQATVELHSEKSDNVETDTKDSQPVTLEECSQVTEVESNDLDADCSDNKTQKKEELICLEPIVADDSGQLQDSESTEVSESKADDADAMKNDEIVSEEVSKDKEVDTALLIATEENKGEETDTEQSKIDQEETFMEVEEEEAIDEEMNLTLDLEPDSEAAVDEISRASEKTNLPESTEMAEEQVEDPKEEQVEDPKEEPVLPEAEESKEDPSSNQEEVTKDIQYSQEPSSDSTEIPAIDANTESSTDHQLQDDSKIEDSAENLKSILGNVEDVVQMLSEEQSQHSQDIMKRILDTVDNGTEMKNILETEEESVENVIDEDLQKSPEMTEDEELSEKIPEEPEELMNTQLEDPITAQNIDTLEEMLNLELIDNVASKEEKSEDESMKKEETKDNDVDLLLEDTTQETNVPQDYVAEMVSDCLTDAAVDPLQDTIDDDIAGEDEQGEDSLKVKHESMISDAASKDSDDAIVQKELEEESGLQENELDIDFVENPLESVGDLEEAEVKLDLEEELLLDNADQSEVLNDVPTESSQPNSEISELESAVKFLQESEEQTMDSPLVLSPKLVESVVEDISKQADVGLFEPDEDICPDAGDLVDNLGDIAADSISISEAEIISEAAKLESERKMAEQSKLDAALSGLKKDDLQMVEGQDELGTLPSADVEMAADKVFDESARHMEGSSIAKKVEGRIISENLENTTETLEHAEDVKSRENVKDLENRDEVMNVEKMDNSQVGLVQHSQALQSEPVPFPRITERVQKIPESKVSILEERLKEPPQIEIPITEITRICDAPVTPKNNLLIPKDAKINAYQRMLDSPKASEKTESKYVETPRKDSEKHDFENVGSPRIILKIAKSAIADCGEPRSPKSPKIRSATNSPNPEDSPGQKLGKIKLKLSRGGHPSIISNENIEETAQWHTEGSALSPIGMKIKLTKSGDASIVSSEKHDFSDDLKDGMKRTESPIGMKIKLSKSGDASIVQQDTKECVSKHKDVALDSPKRIDSPIGMKIKLSKTGDASIIQPDKLDMADESKESSSKSKDRLDVSQKLPKRTDSPLGVKIKLSKSGDASIVSSDVLDDSKETVKSKEKHESSLEMPKRTDSPIGMKIKLSKTKTGTSIVPIENEDSREKLEIPDIPKRTDSPLGMKIKLSKTGDASIIHSELADESRDARNKERSEFTQEGAKLLDSPSGTKSKLLQEGECVQESPKEKGESAIGMKIKLSKSGDASIIPSDKDIEEQRLKELHQDVPKRTDSPLGMKIKLSKSGDASIVQSEEERIRKMENEQQRPADSSLGMKIKLSKSGDASIMESEKRDKQQKRRENDPSLEMKIKLSKTGHPTIIPPETHGEFVHKMKESPTDPQYKDFKESLMHKDSALKILKSNHPTIVSNRAELTIEPVQLQGKILESALEMPSKRKDVTISPIEMKKSKLEAHLSHILPEVTIQPVMSRDQKQLVFDPKTSLISRQQMNVISQEISITQVRPPKPPDMSISDKLKTILSKNSTGPAMNADCEIIDHRPELIIVNENSNSSQDVMIIDEVPPMRMPDSSKTPKKRGRPRRNPVQPRMIHHPAQMMMPRDPLALDDAPQAVPFEQRENERPKRTCRNQKSYAPPKRGRGRGRGKRKLEVVDFPGGKKPKLEQDLTAIEKSTMSVITLESSHLPSDLPQNSSELYKALKQPPMDRKGMNTLRPFEDPSMLAMRNETGQQTDHLKMPGMAIPIQLHPGAIANVQEGMCKAMPKLVITPNLLESKSVEKNSMTEIILGKETKVDEKSAANSNEKSPESAKGVVVHDAKGMLVPPGHPNWLTPTSKKQIETATRNEPVSTVQVIDEDTRMSAESGSRSQTPARNIPVPASETIINEESQGSVLSTATTESEKVKVKNRRMEINFDPDEGPFTVDKIAEYEWPLDRKGETFMIQEQISQYLGVKSFKRKYPDLKRRMVDMEERNYLRENGLVSEAMCDMGLTAVCSSEVLDVMCSDFPDQYEEYRKHMREKQVKEHSKKQKELTAAANAEKNRIDLAEMAVQSAVSWNISLNKARRETRKCSLDLQTFTIHVPKKEQKVEERRASHYPVALIPGQYTDYYREYTPAELRYYPLNTVLYGPMRPNMRKFDSQSEGSQSDSDSDSSSDDSSSSSSEETQDTEESQSTMDDVDMELTNQKEEVKIKCKMCFKSTNKHGKPEILIQCGTCNGNVHPSCIDLTLDTVPHIQSYAWQCTDCKTCSQCHDPANEDKMLFCDMCDRGYHIYCVGLRRVPQGRWHCQECAVCANCGSREPGGANSDRNSVAQWQHEYKKGDKNTRVYVSTLCVPCSKLWRKGRYCPHCSRCHTATRLDLEPNLVHCSACDKYLHLGCVETKGIPFDKKSYLCDFCSPSRQQMLKPLASKIFKT